MKFKETDWSDWYPFPNLQEMGVLIAPYGPGVYEVKVVESQEYILVGVSKNCAYRMTSLFPRPHGAGGRTNAKKRNFVRRNVGRLQYRFKSFRTREEAQKFETQRRRELKGKLKFAT